jgi:hypothetical protein
MYLIGIGYIARAVVNQWRDRGKCKIDYKKGQVFRSLNLLQKSLCGVAYDSSVFDYERPLLKAVSNFSQLVLVAQHYLDNKLVELRQQIEEAVPIFNEIEMETRFERFRQLIGKIDFINEIMTMSEKLPVFYKGHLKKMRKK